MLRVRTSQDSRGSDSAIVPESESSAPRQPVQERVGASQQTFLERGV